MRARPALVLALALLTVAFAQWRPPEPFPHRQHAKVFPTCAGCHEGVINEERANRFPSSDACARCHDGEQLKRVSWTAPHQRATNLKFSHIEHVREASRGGAKVDCQSCHREAGADSSAPAMAVGAARPSNCITCHAHQASEHLADNAVCSTCHVPLAQARLVSDSAIAAFPRPRSHARPDFISTHAPTGAADAARCATCHTSESCARCHPNASRVAAIGALGSDARVARLVAGKKAVYPTPATHREPLWAVGHADAARANVQACANCHTQPGCRSCHTGRLGASAITQLPDGTQGAGAGVPLRHAGARAGAIVAQLPTVSQQGRSTPPGGSTIAADTARSVRVHPTGFLTTHAATAGSGRLACQGCHEQRFCADCHDGSGRNRFHKVNYASRHAADAYSRDRNCSSCHNTETFCRTCHANNGIASRGGIRGSAHNGQPLWQLQHGQAAREGLEGCTSCHQQRDCLRCHSSTGLHTNPHGPGFRASQMQSRNRQVCLVCHVGDPLAR